MKIVHWNLSRTAQPAAWGHGVASIIRYEDELFENIKALREDLEIERIKRVENRVMGSVPVSYFLRYRCRDADIVHATVHMIAPAAYFKRPRRFIVTVTGLSLFLSHATIADASMKLQWILTPKALKKVDRIIAISGFTKKEVVRLAGVDESVIDVVHLGVDHSRYYPMGKTECKRTFGLDTNEKHILVVSTTLPHKRVDLVKAVFDELRKQRSDIKLIKAGSGTLSGDGIINPGYIPESEMPILFNSADVFLNTSEYEGFCLPILEAMSCGVPVVVSNKASIQEVVGSYGNMVDLDSDDVVDQFVNKILSSIDKGIDEEAIEQSKNFSWIKTAEETVKVYEKVYSQ